MSPSLHLHVTPGDDAPIYRQIVRQVAEAVASGTLEAGERLPSLRELAKKLVVSPLTVKKAYDVLEGQGVIETRQGQGTFVAEGAVAEPAADEAPDRGALERLRPLARRLCLEAHLVGVVERDLVELLRLEGEILRLEREDQDRKEIG